MDAKQIERAITYSQQLATQASTDESLAALTNEVRQVLSVFDQQNLEQFFNKTTVDKTAKANVLTLLQAEVSPILANFFEEMKAEESYQLVYLTLAELIHQSQASMGEYDMTVTTVVPLTASQKLRFISKAEQLFHLKIRQVTEVIKPEILGGFIMEVNHRVVDASVRHQLQEAKENFN